MNYVSIIQRQLIVEYAERFPRGHCSFLGSGSEKKWYGTYECKPDGSWNQTAEKMLHNFAGSGHLIFHCTSALEKDNWEAKEEVKTSSHFNGSTENVELLLLMVISVNQLTLHGAVAHIIAELPVGRRAPVKPVASGQLDKQEILARVPLAELQANEERQGTLLKEYEQRFVKLSRLCPEAGLRSVQVGHFFCVLYRHQEEKRFEIKKGLVSKVGSQAMYNLIDLGQSLK